MKVILFSFALTFLGSATTNAQGTVEMFNAASSYLISTNNGFGSSTGLISTTASSYYFALLIDSSIPTSSNPLTGGWSIAQSDGINVIAHNSTTVAGGIGDASTPFDKISGFSVDGWAPGTAYYVEIVGWSAAVGTTWSEITSQLQYGWNYSGYYGVSNIGSITPYTGYPVPPAIMFGANGISSGFTLNFVGLVPEPSVFTFAGFGCLLITLWRSRKF
jgi:hypothetical protein